MKRVWEILAYMAFASVVGLLSAWPRYQLVPEDDAIVSLAFSHAAERIGECRRLTQAELDKLPPNMRKPDECPRERHPIRLLLRSDEAVLYAATLPPSGIWADGKANVYERIYVRAGTHTLSVGMNDSGNGQGFDYELTKTLEIGPGRNVLVRFVDGGFQIR